MPLYIFNHWDADGEESLIWAASIQLCSLRALGEALCSAASRFGQYKGCRQGARLQTGSQRGEKTELWVWEFAWNNGGIRDLLGELSKLHGSASRDTDGQQGSAWFQKHLKPGWAQKILAQPLPPWSTRDDHSPLSFLNQFSLIFKPVSLSPL